MLVEFNMKIYKISTVFNEAQWIYMALLFGGGGDGSGVSERIWKYDCRQCKIK